MVDREKQGKAVVPFIASYFNDKRPTEPLHRGRESVPRQQRRVCDGATSALIHHLEETGLCEKYDARFGNPGGEGMQSKRDEVMRAVVKVFQDNSLLPADFWAKLPPPRLPKADADKSAGTAPSATATPSIITEPKQPDAPKPAATTGANNEPQASTSWALVVVTIAAAPGLLWLMLKRRS